MSFYGIEVQRVEPCELRRQLWTFDQKDNSLRLTRYADEERKTKRHKWRPTGLWDCMDERRYHSSLSRPETIPEDVLSEALEIVRKKPFDVYIGWFNVASIYKTGI